MFPERRFDPKRAGTDPNIKQVFGFAFCALSEYCLGAAPSEGFVPSKERIEEEKLPKYTLKLLHGLHYLLADLATAGATTYIGGNVDVYYKHMRQDKRLRFRAALDNYIRAANACCNVVTKSGAKYVAGLQMCDEIGSNDSWHAAGTKKSVWCQITNLLAEVKLCGTGTRMTRHGT